MNTAKLNGALFSDLVKNGANNLRLNKKTVDELNVFPVPDGDTGENMSMTIDSARGALEEKVGVGEAAKNIAREMLLGARGNSGVILSRIFAGIAEGLNKKIEVSVAEFHEAMQWGVREAYGAVATPVEGTILTVLRESVNYAGSKVETSSSFEEYFENLVNEMRNSIKRTPDFLPTLKEAGVVDSGGVGLMYIFEGMRNTLYGQVVESNSGDNEHAMNNHDVDVSLFDENSELTFGYCTEFLLRLQNKKINLDDFNVDDFIEYLKSVGDSVVAFQDGSIVKAHVHTKTPGEVLTHCQGFGEFLKIKVENMTLQHNGALIKNNSEFKSKPHKKYGIITVANGEGMIKIFEELGCDVVVAGGQSMNPSTNDFVDAIKEIDAETIFIFPNNKNIIMSAEQAAGLVEKDVRVIKTKTIGEGYAAISMFDSTIETPEDLIKNLGEIIAGVKTGQISKASRDATIGGKKVVTGNYIGFSNGKILAEAKKISPTFFGLAKELKAEKFDIAILVFGKDINKDEAKSIEKKFRKEYNKVETYTIDGGQPIYDLILILE